jgi:hypothetical protein
VFGGVAALRGAAARRVGEASWDLAVVAVAVVVVVVAAAAVLVVVVVLRLVLVRVPVLLVVRFATVVVVNDGARDASLVGVGELGRVDKIASELRMTTAADREVQPKSPTERVSESASGRSEMESGTTGPRRLNETAMARVTVRARGVHGATVAVVPAVAAADARVAHLRAQLVAAVAVAAESQPMHKRHNFQALPQRRSDASAGWSRTRRWRRR